MNVDYSHVTETPGILASREQIERLFHRYHFASSRGSQKDVLEVACGAGIGLGYLARAAKKVVGGDIDETNIALAARTYRDRQGIFVLKLNGQELPFVNQSFDVVLLYEAIYYLPHPEQFVQEVHRILRADGVLIVCTVNNQWPDFNPSPHSVRYFSGQELAVLLSEQFTSVELYGAFDTRAVTLRDKVVSFVKRTAVSLNLMPKTMKGKELFKRVFFGKLLPIPPEVQDEHEYHNPVLIPPDKQNSDYKVLYAVAIRRKQSDTPRPEGGAS